MAVFRWVRNSGSVAVSSPATTGNITVPAAGHAIGNTVFVAVNTNTGTTSTVTDSKSNTYTRDVTSGTGVTSLYRAVLTTALVSGDTITVTNSTSGTFEAAGVEFEGVLAITPLDQSTSLLQSTPGTTLTPTVTGTTTQADEVVFEVFGVGGNISSFVPGNGYTSLPGPQTTSTLAWCWKIVTATATFGSPATINTSLAARILVATYKAGAVAPTNLTAPTITGDEGVGETLTLSDNGTWSGSPSGYSPQWQRGFFNGASTGWHDITGATSSTYDQVLSDTSLGVRCRVTATNANGDSSPVGSNSIEFWAARPPWNTRGNPWDTPLPAGVAVDAAWTTTLRSYLTSQYGIGNYWYFQGGAYGTAFSSILHVVTSDMPRTPFVLRGGNHFDFTIPMIPATQNGDTGQHLSWSCFTQHGGVPTPAGGFLQPAGSDVHICVYVQDTHEYYEWWTVYYDPTPAGPAVQHADYADAWTYGYGGYIPDVRDNPGFFETLTSYVYGNRSYDGWGAMATGLPYFLTTMMTEELMRSELNHAIGVVLPASNHTIRYPATRSEGGIDGPMPLGGIWQIDPSIDVDALSTAGLSANDVLLRGLILKAAQRYGIIPVDTSGGSTFGLRFDAVANQAFGFSITAQQILTAVPVSAWRVIDAGYRPAIPRADWTIG